jgi:hypothetical protein
MPRRTVADAMAHDGRWTLRWCKHWTGGCLDDRNFAGVDTRARRRGAGEDLREDEADRRAPSVNDGGGAGNGNMPLMHEIGVGGTAALG